MEREERLEKIAECLGDMSFSELVDIHNQYCQSENYMDDWIYSMGEFDEILGETKPHELASLIFYGDFNPNHDWFAFDGYANLVSFSYDDKNCPIDIDDLSRFIDDTEDDCGYSELEDVINEIYEYKDSFEDEDEDEEDEDE